MLKEVEASKELSPFTDKIYEVYSGNEMIGRIVVTKNAGIIAQTAKCFNSVKGAERWLKLI